MKKLFFFSAVLLGSVGVASAQTGKSTSQKPPASQPKRNLAAAKKTAELMKIKQAGLTAPTAPAETGIRKIAVTNK